MTFLLKCNVEIKMSVKKTQNSDKKLNMSSLYHHKL